MVVHSITVQDQFRVHVGIVGSGTGLQPDSLCAKNLPYIVSAWSGITSSPRQSSEPSSQSAMVQREFVDLQGRSLTIWEDTGESIARHIWDAGLVLTSWLINIQSFQTGGMHELANLFRDNGHGRTNVLELGTGCGIVGIGLAQLLPRCQLLLTDLPDAKEVVEMNIAANSPATASRIAFAELDWDSSLPHCVQKSHFDLILVSDCTYNPGSARSLVKTLVSLVSISPDAAILLASKTRHSSEKVFFDLMEDAMLRKFEHVVIPLPNAGEDNGTVMQESVQIFTFRSGRGRDSEFSSP
ncbi:MAG: hypothetical protein M1825_000288 [Sarcosagium campestre]|nr:MAG: hypothetical protein M1825_000288 [Sarcosagium campestre]